MGEKLCTDVYPDYNCLNTQWKRKQGRKRPYRYVVRGRKGKECKHLKIKKPFKIFTIFTRFQF